MTIECLADVTVKYGGQVHALQPGHTLDLPPEKAQRLLEQAPGRVRPLPQPISPEKPGGPSFQEIIIEPAATNPKQFYWETGDGRILGPAVPECLAQVGSEFWIVTTFEAQLRWIQADRLRSRHAFERQLAVRE